MKENLSIKDEIEQIKLKFDDYTLYKCDYNWDELSQKVKRILERALLDIPLNENETKEFGKLSKDIVEALFRCLYGRFEPAYFWKTHLGHAIKWVDNQIPQSQVGQVEAAKILGKSEMWVWRNRKYLGAYMKGGLTVFDRDILQRFQNEIIKEHKRLNLEPDYWRTSLGQLVNKLNKERECECNEVGINYILKNLLHEKRSRYWLYQHAEEFGGIWHGKRLIFDKSIAEKKIKERSNEFGFTI